MAVPIPLYCGSAQKPLREAIGQRGPEKLWQAACWLREQPDFSTCPLFLRGVQKLTERENQLRGFAKGDSMVVTKDQMGTWASQHMPSWKENNT